MTDPRGSTSVMARRQEARDSLDDFPTPPWGTRALCRFLDAQGYLIAGQDAWEPAANRGYMVRPLAESFGRVDDSAASATSYAWFIWDVRQRPFVNHATTLAWIPPGTRRALEQPGDYAPTPEAAERRRKCTANL